MKQKNLAKQKKKTTMKRTRIKSNKKRMIEGEITKKNNKL
jgi:hypothetical protein